MSVHHDEAPEQQQDSMSGGLKILLPVLLLCLIAAGIFYMSKDNGDAHGGTHGGHDSTATHENHEAPATAHDTTAVVAKDTAAARPAAHADTVKASHTAADTTIKH